MNPHEHDTLTDAEAVAMEEALASLTLAEPSAAMDRRVAEALQANAAAVPAQDDPLPDAPAPLPFRGKSHWLNGLAVAAVLALLAALGLTLYLQGGAPAQNPGEVVEDTPDTPNHPGPDALAENANTPESGIVPAGYSFQPQPVTLHWTRDLDAGTLASKTGGQPVRAIRRQDVEQEVWVDPERGVTVQITRPTERLVVVKQPTF